MDGYTMWTRVRATLENEQYLTDASKMNDAELIAHFKRDPEEAYGELLRRYSAVILANDPALHARPGRGHGSVHRCL